MYKITDVVEMGHGSLIGGSVSISLEFDDILDHDDKIHVLEIIDYFDHCLVTDNEALSKMSSRYFLLDKSVSIFEDIHTILFEFIKKDIMCTVTLGKESFSKKLKSYSNILKYNHEG